AANPLTMGNAILSRWPIVARADWPLPVPPGESGRSLLYALIDAPFGKVPVFVTHLSWKFHEGEWRCRQVRELDDRAREKLGEGTYPGVLMGDFNASP